MGKLTIKKFHGYTRKFPKKLILTLTIKQKIAEFNNTKKHKRARRGEKANLTSEEVLSL